MGLERAARLYKAPIHARIFVRHHGRTGPFDCTFCGEPVTLLDGKGHGAGAGCVHHLDHDHYNNVISNLAPAHRSCHGRHHHANREFTPEHRAAISAGLKAKGIRPPVMDRTGIGKGIPKSPEHRAAIGEAQRRKWASGTRKGTG